MKIKVAILSILIAIMMTGCIGFHEGNIQNSISLSSANYEYVLFNASGESKKGYFLLLGLGGGTGTLVAEAKKELNQKYRLKNNQAFANYTTNFITRYYLGILYIETTCIITADVVEFTK